MTVVLSPKAATRHSAKQQLDDLRAVVRKMDLRTERAMLDLVQIHTDLITAPGTLSQAQTLLVHKLLGVAANLSARG